MLAVLRQNFGGEPAHVGQHPDDTFASFHLKRLLNGASGVRIAMDHAPGQNRSPRP
jgi:hypothetical protein